MKCESTASKFLKIAATVMIVVQFAACIAVVAVGVVSGQLHGLLAAGLLLATALLCVPWAVLLLLCQTADSAVGILREQARHREILEEIRDMGYDQVERLDRLTGKAEKPKHRSMHG